jgi:hypothetical protein
MPAARDVPGQARNVLNPRLEAQGGNLVLKPVGRKKKSSLRISGRLGEDSYLLYVNADDGREENVLKLLETPGVL